MEFDGICLNCFAQRGEYDVCPWCGYVAGTQPREAYLLHPGVRLWGRYVIGTVLGIGGFGVTYRAWDTRLDAVVAIKEFYPQSLVSRIPGETKVRVFSGDKQESYTQQLARFMDEARNLAKFTGDVHIVSVLDFFEDNNTAYIVMEYLDGMTLKEYMAQQGGRLPFQQAMDIEKSLLSALSAVHQKGIIHRDISPDNIFILNDGSMKLLDFGAARFAARENPEFTQSVVVKKGYAPPEQYRSNMKQGVWTDIYAAGATLYKMLTGITPEESIERTEKDTLQRPSQTGTAVETAVDKGIMKAMALRPELRFKSADAMLAALENRTVIDFPEEELKKRKRSRALITVLAVLAVLVLGGLVVWQAATRPVTTGSLTLADMDIAPDTISILVTGDENRTAVFNQLIAAFNERYPEHTVNLEVIEWYEGIYDDLSPRFETADAPTIYTSYFPNQPSEEVDADLTPLVKSLEFSDYLFLDEYFGRYEKRDDPRIFSIPTGFSFSMAYGNAAAAAERGITLPAAITSYEQVIDWEMETPGTVRLQSYEYGRLLGYFKPDIRDEGGVELLADYYGEYTRRYLEGYFERNYGEGAPEYLYSSTMLEIGDSYTSGYRNRQNYDYGGNIPIPLLDNGALKCQMNTTYSVSARVTENQQMVGMLFLHFMLSERAQNIIHVQNDDVQPLNRAALDQYIAANPAFAFLTDGSVEKMQYGTMSYYVNNMYEIFEAGGGEDEVRAAILEEYGERWS